MRGEQSCCGAAYKGEKPSTITRWFAARSPPWAARQPATRIVSVGASVSITAIATGSLGDVERRHRVRLIARWCAFGQLAPMLAVA